MRTLPIMNAPVIGIAADLIDHNGLLRAATPVNYINAVAAAGGVPVVMPPHPSTAIRLLEQIHGLVLTGGDDPATETFGVPTDARVTRVHPQRQSAESLILEHLAAHRPDMPVLGVCLGMQMMALHAGGQLDQFMPDTTPTHANHWERSHAIQSLAAEHLTNGVVDSKHKQAVVHSGGLRMIAEAHDGVCEAIVDSDRRFYLGVQWHPERTEQESLGIELFRRLIQACRT